MNRKKFNNQVQDYHPAEQEKGNWREERTDQAVGDLLAGGDDNGSAFQAEALGDAEADALSWSGDDHDLAFEPPPDLHLLHLRYNEETRGVLPLALASVRASFNDGQAVVPAHT